MSDRQEEKYRRILRECHPLITAHCNPDELVGPLSAQHLLTSNETYTLGNRLLPPLQRLNELMEWLPRKGDNWFERFATALATRKEGIIPATDGHVTVLKKIWEKAQEVNCPLPARLQVWLPAAEPQDFGNCGDSLLDNPSDFSLGSPGASLPMEEEASVSTTVPVEETYRPMQEQHRPDDDDGTSPSMIILDKVSSLLYKALGYNWERIHTYCYRQHRQFAVAIGNIKRQFHDHPHMQILMTLKQWTKAQNCSSQQLFDKIKPLLEHSPSYQSQLRELLFTGHHHHGCLRMENSKFKHVIYLPSIQQLSNRFQLLLSNNDALGNSSDWRILLDTSQVTVTRPTEILDKQEIDKISRKMFGQISPAELDRIAIYYEINDDTMATLVKGYGHSPVTLLSNILLHWINDHHQPTRGDFAVILDDLGISPNSVM